MKIGYDSAGRLETVWENGLVTGTYGYDENGNRLSHGGMEATYDDQDRMMTYGDNAYTYTVNGDILTKTDTQGTPDTADDELTGYTHDALGNLTGVTLPDGTAIAYTYDGRNRRIARSVDGTVTERFVYLNQLKPAAKVDGAGQVIETYIYGTRINTPDYLVRGADKYRMISDERGSVRLVVKVSDGTVAQRIDYDEFGNVVADTNPGFQPFYYAGGVYDLDTKLVKFGARDYDPETGRWLEKEPLGFAGSNNFYNYCEGDPVNWMDPSGLDKAKISVTFMFFDFSITIYDSQRGFFPDLGLFSPLFDYEGVSSALVGAGLTWEFDYNECVDRSQIDRDDIQVYLGLSEYTSVSFDLDMNLRSVNLGASFPPTPINISYNDTVEGGGVR